MSTETKDISEQLKTSTSKQPVTVVVGAGPAGLSSVFSLLLKGHKVIMIDNRDEDTRKQRVFMSEELIKSFYAISALPRLGITLKFDNEQHQFELVNLQDRKLVAEENQLDLDFFVKLSKNNCAISIKDLQTYQFQKLRVCMQNKTIHFESMEYVELKQRTEDFLKALKNSDEAFQEQAKLTDLMLKTIQVEFSMEVELERHKLLLDQLDQKENMDTSRQELSKKTEELLNSLREKYSALLSLEHKQKLLPVTESNEDERKKSTDNLQILSNKLKQELYDIHNELSLLTLSYQNDAFLYKRYDQFRTKIELIRVSKEIQIRQIQESLLKNYKEIQAYHSQYAKMIQALKEKVDELGKYSLQMTGNLTIFRGAQYQITKIDGTQQILTLQNSKEGNTTDITFDHFVAADGSKHEMVNLLNTSSKDFVVEYAALKPPRQLAHGVMVLKLQNNPKIKTLQHRISGPHLPNSSHLKLCDLEMLKQVKWEKGYLPVMFLDFNPEMQECYMVGEIPEFILETQDIKSRNEQLQQYGECIAKLELGLEPQDIEKFEFASSFKLQPMCANKNVIELGKKGIFFIVGDAFLSANFLFGHGVSNAITDGNTLFHCFDEQGKLETLEPMMQKDLKNRQEYEKLAKAFEALLNSKHRVCADDHPDARKMGERAPSPTFTPLLEGSSAVSGASLGLQLGDQTPSFILRSAT